MGIRVYTNDEESLKIRKKLETVLDHIDNIMKNKELYEFIDGKDIVKLKLQTLNEITNYQVAQLYRNHRR